MKSIFSRIKKKLDKYYIMREEAIKLQRDLLRVSREAIQLIHNGKIRRAEEILTEGKELINRINFMGKEEPRIIYSGAWIDASKEYCEALLLLFVVREKGKLENISIPSPDDLGVLEEAWILGLAEVTGELKREILLALNAEKIDLAQAYLNVIKEIYGMISKLAYPGAIIPGIKSKVDYVRSIMLSSEEIIIRFRHEIELKKKIEMISK